VARLRDRRQRERDVLNMALVEFLAWLVPGWLLLNELVPVFLLDGTVPWPDCPGRERLPPRTWVRCSHLVSNDGGFTVVLGPFRWIVVNVSVPTEYVPMLLVHEAAHIKFGHPRKLWVLYLLCLQFTDYFDRKVAQWEAEVDLEVDRVFGHPGAGMGLRWAIRYGWARTPDL
jgi:hypothetical protein